ncbi:MAG: response regulator [Acidobacteria bacterium]|nr:response regulator [Acidobacteriota bacterium]
MPEPSFLVAVTNVVFGVRFRTLALGVLALVLLPTAAAAGPDNSLKPLGDAVPLGLAFAAGVGAGLAAATLWKKKLNQEVSERLAAEERFRQITDSVPGIIFQLRQKPDGKRKITFVSRQLAGITSSQAASGLGSWAAAIENVIAEDLPGLTAALDRSAARLERWVHEFRLKTPDGSLRWQLVEAQPKILPNGDIVWNGFLTDVTERRKLEKDLREAEERWQLALAASEDGTWDWDPVSGKIWFSRRWKGILGFEDFEIPDEFTSFQELLHPADAERVLGELQAFVEGRTWDLELEFRMSHKDGGWRWIVCRAAGQRDEAGHVRRLVASNRDITRRKLAEMELKKLSEAVQQNPSMIFVTSRGGEIEYVNPRFTQLTGYTADEIRGRTPNILKSGQVSRAVFENLWQTILSGEPWRGELLNKKKNGELFWASVSISGVKGEQGAIENFVCIEEDITERKHAEKELENSRDELAAQRSELADAVEVLTQTQIELARAKEAAESASRAKSEFLANMSHEIRTPMNAVIGLSHLALQTSLTPKQRDYITRIHRSAQNLLGIINDILDVSKIEAGKLTLESVSFNLEEVLDNLATVLSPRVNEKELELLIAVEPEVPKLLMGDPLRLGQVLLNLAGNAVKFTEKGEIAVRASLAGRSETGVELRFEVKDTGIGLSRDQMSRLFTAFSQADSSTTRKYGGTGLGLTISKRLVELMNGRIWVESEPGKGSRFCFTAAFGLTDHAPLESLAPPADLRGLRVLVVDDSHSARMIASEMLVAMGFRVDAVASGPEAVELVEKASASGEPFRVVLMDWKMSPWDGLETARRIQGDAVVGDKPVIVMMTAHGREDVMRQAESMGIKGFLLKPMSPSLLLNMLVDRIQDDKTVPRLASRATMRRDRVHELRGARILVVDDNEINQIVAREILEACGATVKVADNGEDALISIAEDPPDLVLMDVQMPVMDGLEATARLRQDPQFAKLPVLAMTAHALVEERERCLHAGMNDHVTKTIDPDVLIQTVARYLVPVAEESVAVFPEAEGPLPVATVDVDLPAGVPGFDEREALQRLAGNRRLLSDLLRDFAREQKDFTERLGEAFSREDFSSIRRLAHAMKGVAGNLSLRTVQESAAQVENAAKRGGREEVERLLPSLTGSLEAVLGVLHPWAQPATPDGPPALAGPLDRVCVEAKLKELDTLLLEGNLRADEVFSELSSLVAGHAIAEHEAVSKKIQGLDYAAARPALASLARALDIRWQEVAS